MESRRQDGRELTMKLLLEQCSIGDDSEGDGCHGSEAEDSEERDVEVDSSADVEGDHDSASTSSEHE